jgi:hypothetical protein
MLFLYHWSEVNDGLPSLPEIISFRRRCSCLILLGKHVVICLYWHPADHVKFDLVIFYLLYLNHLLRKVSKECLNYFLLQFKMVMCNLGIFLVCAIEWFDPFVFYRLRKSMFGTKMDSSGFNRLSSVIVGDLLDCHYDMLMSLRFVESLMG